MNRLDIFEDDQGIRYMVLVIQRNRYQATPLDKPQPVWMNKEYKVLANPTRDWYCIHTKARGPLQQVLLPQRTRAERILIELVEWVSSGSNVYVNPSVALHKGMTLNVVTPKGRSTVRITDTRSFQQRRDEHITPPQKTKNDFLDRILGDDS